MHGQGKDKYDNVRIGMTARLDTIQAAVLIEKLKIFPEEIVARDRIAKRYNAMLADVVTVPQVPDGYTSVWAQYTIRARARQARTRLRRRSRPKGIPTAIYYPDPAAPADGVQEFPGRSRAACR